MRMKQRRSGLIAMLLVLVMLFSVACGIQPEPSEPTYPTVEPTGPSGDPTNPTDEPTDPTDPSWDLGVYGPVQSKNVATAEEITRSEEYYYGMVSDISLIPVSFKLDGVAYKGFSKNVFTQVSNVETASEDGSQRKNVITIEHKASGLLFEVTAAAFLRFISLSHGIQNTIYPVLSPLVTMVLNTIS